MELSAKVINELQQLRMKIAALQKEEKELCEDVKHEMRHQKIEVLDPSSSPFKFLLSKSYRSSVEWKKEWEYLAKKFYGKWSWVNRQKSLIRNSQNKVYSLLIEPNENYKPKEKD